MLRIGGQGCRIDTYGVISRNKIAEQIIAACICHYRCCRTIRVRKRDFRIRDPGFACILNTIAVNIIPDPVTNGSHPVKAGIDICDILPALSSDVCRESGYNIYIAVECTVCAGLIGADEHAGRCGYTYGIGSDEKIGEYIIAVRIGRCCRSNISTCVIERYGYTRKAGFPAILNAVCVGILPYKIADGGLHIIAEVHIHNINAGA